MCVLSLVHADVCLHQTHTLNSEALSLIESSVDRSKDLKQLLITALTYLEKQGNIRWRSKGRGVGGCVCDDTTEGDVQMGRGPTQALTHSSQPACSTSAEASAYYRIHLK